MSTIRIVKTSSPLTTSSNTIVSIFLDTKSQTRTLPNLREEIGVGPENTGNLVNLLPESPMIPSYVLSYHHSFPRLIDHHSSVRSTPSSIPVPDDSPRSEKRLPKESLTPPFRFCFSQISFGSCGGRV